MKRNNSLISFMLKMISVFAILVIAPFFIILAAISRLKTKRIAIGLGSEPLINNIYHRRALGAWNYSAETFVGDVYFITDEFDVRADLRIPGNSIIIRFLRFLYVGCLSIWRYRCIYMYFNGGPIGQLGSSIKSPLLRNLEPYLYKLAGVKIVVMPYGSDVQNLTRSNNLLFKNAYSKDYPKHRLRRAIIAEQIDRWTRHADHVISGCEWVDYMYHWDTLMLGHFSIDTELWKPTSSMVKEDPSPLKILHAPNHRDIKGTRHFIEAVDELNREGYNIELVLLERIPNEEVRRVMASVDIVADQLIIGWYAMFALEAMAMGKPVLCYLREDLITLYTYTGLITAGEMPIVNCNPGNVKEVIRELAEDRDRISRIGARSRDFVLEHHSMTVVGKVFDGINRSIGITPDESEVTAL